MKLHYVFRNVQYKDVYGRTIEILQHASIFKTNCCLKVHNADLKLRIVNFGISKVSILLFRINLKVNAL